MSQQRSKTRKPKPKKAGDDKPKSPKKPPIRAELKLSDHMVRSWEDVLLRFAKFPRGTPLQDLDRQQKLRLVIREEADAVAAMWHVFNEDRTQLNRYLSNPKQQAVAYLLGFHLANVARNLLGWQRAQWRYPNLVSTLAASPALQLIDLGCGAGAASVATLDMLSNAVPDIMPKILLNLVDKHSAFLDMAADICKTFSGNRIVDPKRNAIALSEFDQRILTDDAAYILHLGYVWNELSRDLRAQKRIRTVLQTLQSKPTLIVLSDSANQMISRDLMQLRDELVREGYVVLYPCSHQLACPMLDRSRDWCFSEGSWVLPTYQAAIDRGLGVNRTLFASSMYIFASPSLASSLQSPQLRPDTRIVVGRPTIATTVATRSKSKPNAELLLCNDAGLSKEPKPQGLSVTATMRGKAWQTRGIPV